MEDSFNGNAVNLNLSQGSSKFAESIAITQAHVISIDPNAAQAGAPNPDENAFDTSGSAAFTGFGANQIEFLKSLGFTKGMFPRYTAYAIINSIFVVYL